MEIQRVLAIGAGTMGSQVSFYYAMQGFEVTQFDISEDALERCKQHHRAYAADYHQLYPQLSEADIEAGLAKISYSSDLKASAADADLVTESAPEVYDIKQQLYKELGEYCPEHTILTTNSSTMLPSQFAEASGRPDRFLALHYGLWIWRSPIGEVMKHPGTSQEAYEAVIGFADQANLVPIKLEVEQPGYVINTLLVPWLDAGLSLVVNGISTVEDVDKTWMICSGMRMGPLGVVDQVGFEVVRNITRMKSQLDPSNPIYSETIEFLEENYINKGRTGALSGAGFYEYPNPAYEQPDFLK